MSTTEGGKLNSPEPLEEGAEQESRSNRLVGIPGFEEALTPSNVQDFVERLSEVRDPDAEVSIGELKSVEADIEQAETLIQREKAKDSALGSVRAELDTPHGTSDTLKKLEHAKERLVEEKQHIELAEQYNTVLDRFTELDLSRDELAYMEEHGEMRDNKEVFRDSRKNIVDKQIMKQLAHHYRNGGRRLTWGAAKELGAVANELLKTFTSVVKGIVRGAGDERLRSA